MKECDFVASWPVKKLIIALNVYHLHLNNFLQLYFIIIIIDFILTINYRELDCHRQ